MKGDNTERAYAILGKASMFAIVTIGGITLLDFIIKQVERKTQKSKPSVHRTDSGMMPRWNPMTGECTFRETGICAHCDECTCTVYEGCPVDERGNYDFFGNAEEPELKFSSCKRVSNAEMEKPTDLFAEDLIAASKALAGATGEPTADNIDDLDQILREEEADPDYDGSVHHQKPAEADQT